MKTFEKNINIVKYIDHIKYKNFNIFVLEKCEQSLSGKLNEIMEKKKFKEKTLVQMIIDLLDGLIQLRIYKILHLDIKPGNILVNKFGSCVYADFGLSQKKGEKKIISKGYTQNYSPQEQIQNINSITYRSDVYALGKTIQIIMSVYSKININSDNNYLIQKLEGIISFMVTEEKSLRIDSFELHQTFFDTIKDNLEQFINPDYIQKISQIINLKPFDINKDVLFYSEVKLYYLQLQINLCKQLSLGQIFEAESYFKMALQYQETGDYKASFRLLQQSLEIRKQILEENHIDIALSIELVGSCYFGMKDCNTALNYYLESNKIMKTYHPLKHLNLAISFNNIKRCYQQKDEIENALENQKESLQNFSLFLKLNGKSLPNLEIEEVDKNQQYQMCQIIYLEMLKLYYKDIDSSIIDQIFDVGSFYGKIEDFKSAISLLNECDDFQKRIYKNTHPKCERTQEMLKLYKNKEQKKNKYSKILKKTTTAYLEQMQIRYYYY